MNLFTAGDFIFFKRGDIFKGQIILTRSGSSAAKITFSAYGTGDSPIIDGNLDIISWTRYNGNIWVADCPQLGSVVTNFLINGKSQQIGRYPNSDAKNKGYLTITSHAGKTQLTCSSLTSSPDWTGAEAVVRCERWILNRLPIQSHQGNVLNFSKPADYEIRDNFGFFVQNHLNTLDQPGEWYFDSSNKKMYLYWLNDPNSLKTEASAYSSTFIANNQKYFRIENIEFKGSILTNINIMSSSWIEMNNITISESGTDAAYFGNSSNIDFIKNKIINTNNNAIHFETSKNIILSNNEIYNTALRAGMGRDYISVYMYYKVKNCLIESNSIDNAGYIGIFFGGDTVQVKNNVINNFGMILDDGGGLYTWSDELTQHYNRQLENNFVLNGIGAGEGTDNPARNAAEGIYMDIRTANVTIKNNTVANCNSGIFIYNANHINIIGNTLYNNNKQLRFNHSDEAPTNPINNCSVNNNILIAKSASQMVAEFTTIDDDIQNFGTFDDNYYCRPVDDELIMFTEHKGNSGRVSKYMNLETWQTAYGYDMHSKKSPITIPPYTIANYIGTNRFSNGKFEKDISGWDCFSKYNNCVASWDNNGNLDNGCMKIEESYITGNNDALLDGYGNFDEAIEGKDYILKFSMIASNPGKIANIYMGQAVSPFDLIAPIQKINIGSTRKDFQLHLIPESSTAKAKIYFEISENDAPVWLDNVELYEANIVSTNIDDYVKFYFNSTSSSVTYNMDGYYIDVKGSKYGSFTLQPYTSVVLMKSSPDQIIAITDISVVGEGGATAINTDGGTLQLSAQIMPVDATNNTVTWSISNGTGQASISTTGLITAISSGTVIATATATDGSGVSGSLIITISNIPDSISKTINNSKILVYPNPVTDLLYILSTGSSFNKILIFDIAGIIVYEKINASELSFIDVSDFSKGMYLVQFKDQNNTATAKFVKN
jgi:hypothetical protein